MGGRGIGDDGRERVPLRDTATDAPAAERAGQHMTQPETPVPVRVWVLVPRQGFTQVDGEAIAWTRRQVRVRYLDKHGRTGVSWVWANAVTRVETTIGSRPPEPG